MSNKMRIAYIAHPVGGAVGANLEKIREIVRYINYSEPNVVPFVPYYADVVSLNDSNPHDRSRGFKNGEAIFIRPGVIDELRLYGSHISTGMKQEIILARAMNIPIICSSEVLYQQLQLIPPDPGDWGGLINPHFNPK